jgi:hypothetical protein
MFKSFIREKPHEYQARKAALKRMMPLSDRSIERLSAIASTLHQRYLEDYVFIHINKCGGTSIERALSIPFLNHDTALERRRKLGDTKWRERFKFSVVRNPYHRIASLFFYRHRSQEIAPDDAAERFSHWLLALEASMANGTATKFERPQWDWISDDRDKVMVDHICRLESLSDDLEIVAERLGRPIPVARINKGHGKSDYELLYCARSRQIVESLYAADFERLGYDRES